MDFNKKNQRVTICKNVSQTLIIVVRCDHNGNAKFAGGMPDIRKYVPGYFFGMYSLENSNSFTEQGFVLSFMNDALIDWVIDESFRKYPYTPDSNFNSFEIALRGYFPTETHYTILKPSIG